MIAVKRHLTNVSHFGHASHRLALCPVVMECWDAPMNWTPVCKHQLRWARTIRVCQPLPYFFNILANAGLRRSASWFRLHGWCW